MCCLQTTFKSYQLHYTSQTPQQSDIQVKQEVEAKSGRTDGPQGAMEIVEAHFQISYLRGWDLQKMTATEIAVTTT